MIYFLILIAVACTVVALLLLRQKPKVVPESGFALLTKNGSVYTFLRPTSKGRFMFRSEKGKITSMDLKSLKSMGFTKQYDFKAIRKN